jgi:hypothetical protein
LHVPGWPDAPINQSRLAHMSLFAELKRRNVIRMAGFLVGRGC